MTSTESVWTKFSNRLRSFIAKRISDDASVEDVLQDVFTKIHTGLGRVREAEKLEAWLFQVARRAILDHFRGHSGKHRLSPLRDNLSESTPSSDVTAEVASWLKPLMGLIPEADREVLRLVDLEGMSQKDLAGNLGTSLSGAKSRLQRARKRLKATLLECCRIETDRRGNAIDFSRNSGPCGS